MGITSHGRVLLSILPLGAAAALAPVALADIATRTDASTLARAAVPLPGSVHPLARPDRDIGRLEPSTQLTGLSLLLAASPDQRLRRNLALAAVQDPGSDRYHRWFTPEEYAAEFGASRADVDRISGWLSSQGLTVDGPARTATRLSFHGTVEQVEHAFRTEMHRYRVDGETHFAMNGPPSVPEELAPLIIGVHGAHDFRAKAPVHTSQPEYALPITGDDGGAAFYPVMDPNDFATIYDLLGLYAAHITGAGQSIAIAGRSDFNDADLVAFRSMFDLPASQPVRVLVPGSGASAVNLDLEEAELDLEWTGAVAPGAALYYVFVGDGPSADAIDALNYSIEQRTAPIISLSYGFCEATITAADAVAEEDYGDIAALEGITVVVAAGDTGAAGCDSQSALVATHGKAVQFPASVPSFVAIGGTQFQITSTNQSTYLDGQLDALSYIPESGWNETLFDIDAGYGGLGASTGGSSAIYSKPYWQGPYTPADGRRDVPDLALSASADIMPYVVSMSWTTADGDAQAPEPQALTAFGGTSASAPAFAGVLALASQAIAMAHPSATSGLGNANPVLYALASGTATGAAFHDVQSGDNIVPCQPGSPSCPASPPYQFGYSAGPGYDQVTGMGSVDVGGLVNAWANLTPTSTTLQVAPSDGGLEPLLIATITSNAQNNAMTGLVAFVVDPGDGGVEASLALGAATVQPMVIGGQQQGTASLLASAALASGRPIAAFYSGDLHYLASWSTPTLLTDAPADGGGVVDAALDAGSVDASSDALATEGSNAANPPPGTTGCDCCALGARPAATDPSGVVAALALATTVLNRRRRRRSHIAHTCSRWTSRQHWRTRSRSS